MDWRWFGIKSPVGRGIAGGIGCTFGGGLGFYLNHTPLWLAPLAGLCAGVLVYFMNKNAPDAQGS